MASFGKSKEERFKESQYRSTPPGPGAYSVDTADISDVAARVTFGNTARFVGKSTAEADNVRSDGAEKETLTAAARMERRKSYGMMHSRVRRRSLKTTTANRENRQ